MGTGKTVAKAIEHLLESGIAEDMIILLNLFCSVQGISFILDTYPKINVVTCCIDKEVSDKGLCLPGIGQFTERYFGVTNVEGKLRAS